MKQTRVQHVGDLLGPEGINGGVYKVKQEDGNHVWLVRTPNGHVGDLMYHDVVEHDDGTLTVSPSILVSSSNGKLWHGYLESGVWKDLI